MINGFTGRNVLLSNFYIYPITWKDLVLPAAEYAYQSEKPTEWLERELILHATSPAHAKKLGGPRFCKSKRADWDQVKNDIMLAVLDAKFSAPGMAEMLRETEDEELIENNWWGDTYWGVCNGVGENWLGKLLMQVREGLKI